MPETAVLDDEGVQLRIDVAGKDNWERFLKQNNRDFQNAFVGSLISIYDSFSGFYSWERDGDELSKIGSEGRRPTSDFLVRLLTPETWKDFENCMEEERVYIEFQTKGERSCGVILKDQEGRYFVGGFQLSDYEDAEEVDIHPDEDYGIN